MFKKTTITAVALSIAVISTQLPAQASIGPMTFESNLTKMSINLVSVDTFEVLEKNTASASAFTPVLVAWSIKSAYKKAKKRVKKVGRNVRAAGSPFVKPIGRGIRKVNRVIVPSEIRNGSSWAYGKIKRGTVRVGRAVENRVRNPYGKRCKANKYLQPVCTVKSKRRPVSISRPARTRIVRPGSAY